MPLGQGLDVESGKDQRSWCGKVGTLSVAGSLGSVAVFASKAPTLGSGNRDWGQLPLPTNNEQQTTNNRSSAALGTLPPLVERVGSIKM